jgi:hypothetical protein
LIGDSSLIMVKEIQDITAEDIMNRYQGSIEFVRLWVMDAPVGEVQKVLTLSATKDTPGTNRAILEGLTLRASMESSEAARSSTRLAKASNTLAIIMVGIGVIQLGGFAYQVSRDHRTDYRNVFVSPGNIPAETDDLEDKPARITHQSGRGRLDDRVDAIPVGEVKDQEQPAPEDGTQDEPKNQ